MSKRTFPVGDKQTSSGQNGGLGHKGYVVDTKSDMGNITPSKAQTNKKNYAVTPYQTNGCK